MIVNFFYGVIMNNSILKMAKVGEFVCGNEIENEHFESVNLYIQILTELISLLKTIK